MKVCDTCADLDVETFGVEMIIQKEERKKKKKNVITIPFDLCDKCLTVFCRNLGNLKKAGILSGRNKIKKPKPEFSNNFPPVAEGQP